MKRNILSFDVHIIKTATNMTKTCFMMNYVEKVVSDFRKNVKGNI